MKFKTFFLIAILSFLHFGLHAATVTGALQDISIQPLNTMLMFAPTNDVLLTGSGLNAGPPKTIETSSGQFSVVLEAGDYTVSLPLVPWRHSFVISVPNTNGTINVTNLLAAPHSYTYTNNLNYTLKAGPSDSGPDFLDAKLSVAGSLVKTLVTNSGVVSVTLSNPGPIHANASRIITWSTNGETSLLDGSVTIPAGTLGARSIMRIEAFGSFGDPGGSSPSATIRLKLGATTILTQSKSIGTSGWHLHATVTLRGSGSSAGVVSAMALSSDDGSVPFPMSAQTATVNATTSLALNLTAAIDNIAANESVTCDQLIVSLE